MPTADEWREVRDEILASGGLDLSPATPRLYALAAKDGSAGLWSFQGLERDVVDLVHDVLIEIWGELPEASSPRALFLKVLRFRAIDMVRKRKGEATLGGRVSEPQGHQSEEALSAPILLDEALAFLSASSSSRDMGIFVACVVFGEVPAEVARSEGLMVANVYQIVSRGRKRLKEYLDADPE